MWNESSSEYFKSGLGGESLLLRSQCRAQDIEGMWAFGFREPDPFPVMEEMEREKERDELVSVV